MSTYFEHHVFICLNQRDNGRDCCMQRGAQAGFEHMKTRVKALQRNGKGQVRINRAGCLDRCSAGPVMVIYPEAVWYTFHNTADIDEIIDQHLLNGQTVKRLLVDPV